MNEDDKIKQQEHWEQLAQLLGLESQPEAPQAPPATREKDQPPPPEDELPVAPEREAEELEAQRDEPEEERIFGAGLEEPTAEEPELAAPEPEPEEAPADAQRMFCPGFHGPKKRCRARG